MNGEAMNQIDMKRAILVWPFDRAPVKYKNLSTSGGDEDWVAFIPDGAMKPDGYTPTWMDEGGPFGWCSVKHYPVKGGRVVIGSHA